MRSIAPGVCVLLCVAAIVAALSVQRTNARSRANATESVQVGRAPPIREALVRERVESIVIPTPRSSEPSHPRAPVEPPDRALVTNEPPHFVPPEDDETPVPTWEEGEADAAYHDLLAAIDANAETQYEESVNGAVLSSWYSEDRPEFLGSQVPAADGTWQREGEWRAWHETGTPHELGSYREGFEHGPWKWWYDDGRRMAQGSFDRGDRVGMWTFWHESGGMGMKGAYERGDAEGLWTYWNEVGGICSQGRMEAGELSGRWTVYRDDGTLDPERSGRFEAGIRVGD